MPPPPGPSGSSLNSSLTSEEVNAGAGLVSDCETACGVSDALTQRQRSLRLLLIMLCGATIIVHVGLLSGLVDLSRTPGVYCHINGGDSCACDLGRQCDDSSCSCGDGRCCSLLQYQGRYCHHDTMEASFEWKVRWALNNGCIAAGDPTSGAFFCPSSMQAGAPPKIDGNEPLERTRDVGDCYIPQAPPMVGADSMPPV